MELSYEIHEDGSVINARFEGLNGCERVTSVKQALNVMKVENPAVRFARDAKAGMYDNMSDEEYVRMLRAVECISMLWRCDGDEPADKSTRTEMNALMLLANAIETISRQNVRLHGRREPERPSRGTTTQGP